MSRFAENRASLEKVHGATRLAATGLTASEREICLSEGLREDLSKNSEPPPKNGDNLRKLLKTSKKNLRNPLKTSIDLTKKIRKPHSQRPSQRQVCLSEALRPVAPIVLPLHVARGFAKRGRRNEVASVSPFYDKRWIVLKVPFFIFGSSSSLPFHLIICILCSLTLRGRLLPNGPRMCMHTHNILVIFIHIFLQFGLG